MRSSCSSWIGLSNAPVVNRLTCPPSDRSLNSDFAARADDPKARPMNSIESPRNQLPSSGSATNVSVSFSTPRLRWRSRQPSSPSSRSPVLVPAGAAPAAVPATDASAIRGAFGEPSRRKVNDDALRADGRTLIIVLRAARKPAMCTRTRYGPGGSCLSVNCPVLSETAKAVVPPSADTTAPSTGRPASSVTVPWMDPVSTAAIVVTASGFRDWAWAEVGWPASRQARNAGATRRMGVPITTRC